MIAIPGIDPAAPRKKGDDETRVLPTRIRLWDFQAKKQTWISEKMSCPATIAVSPDGNLIAAGGDWEDTAICVWSVKTGKLLMKLRGSREIATDLTFSSDGRQLLSTFQDGNVILWDVSPAP